MTATQSLPATPTPTSEGFDFDALEREVMRRADELTPELLPRLLMQLLKRDSLVFCERHMKHLFPYIRCQIALTKAKRSYYRDWTPPCSMQAAPPPVHNGVQYSDHSEMAYRMAEIARDNARKLYRSTPCVCFKSHR
jgi:hypothetical protein